MIRSKLRTLSEKAILWHATRRGLGSYRVYAWAKKYVNYYDGVIDNIDFNGEDFLLRQLGPYITTAFDVGANKGDYLQALRRSAQTATVHAFEIIPQTFNLLKERFPNEPHLNCVGLSNKNGQEFAWFQKDKSNLSTLAGVTAAALPDAMRADKISVSVLRGDLYCRRNGIQSIDLLKVDTEGHDHAVLEGFGKYLYNSINVIQFEYNHLRAYSGFLLKDFYLILGDTFFLGRLGPHGVEFAPYQTIKEDFRGPNYVAIRKDRPDFVERVASPMCDLDALLSGSIQPASPNRPPD